MTTQCHSIDPGIAVAEFASTLTFALMNIHQTIVYYWHKIPFDKFGAIIIVEHEMCHQRFSSNTVVVER